MPKRVKVPQYAKSRAREGLLRRRIDGAGLTRREAEKQGIDSGVERAKQILKQDYISESTAKKIARFWLRFRNCTTRRCETALNLWGGRRFGRTLYNRYYR